MPGARRDALALIADRQPHNNVHHLETFVKERPSAQGVVLVLVADLQQPLRVQQLQTFVSEMPGARWVALAPNADRHPTTLLVRSSNAKTPII